MFNDTHRIKQLSLLAHELQMEFLEQEDYSILPYLRDFKIFTPRNNNNSKKIYNLLRRTDDFLNTKITLFDYKYTNGENGRKYFQTVFFINSKSLHLPDFHLQPETYFHKLIAKLGFDDIDFDSHQKFSEHYHLKGDDEEMIRNTFKEPILQYFTFNKNWHLEGIGYYLILYKHNSKTSIRDINNLYSRGMKLFNFLKEKE